MYKSVEGVCIHCGKTYFGNPSSKYCGYDCSHADRRRRVTLICQECGKEFERQEWNFTAKFCSYQCKYKSKSSDIIEVNCTNCKEKFKRKSHRLNRNQSGNNFCCKKCADEFNSGRNHYEWKEHLHDKNEKNALKQWAKIIKERDKFICQLCGESNKKYLEAHHLKDRSLFPELTYDFNNGITLCLKCHALQHINDSKSYRLIMHKINNFIN